MSKQICKTECNEKGEVIRVIVIESVDDTLIDDKPVKITKPKKGK